MSQQQYNDQYRTPPAGTSQGAARRGGAPQTPSSPNAATFAANASGGGFSMHETPPHNNNNQHQYHHQQQQQQQQQQQHAAHHNHAHLLNQLNDRMGQILDDADHKRCSEGNQRALLAEKLERLRLLTKDIGEDDWKYHASKSTHNGLTLSHLK